VNILIQHTLHSLDHPFWLIRHGGKPYKPNRVDDKNGLNLYEIPATELVKCLISIDKRTPGELQYYIDRDVSALSAALMQARSHLRLKKFIENGRNELFVEVSNSTANILGFPNKQIKVEDWLVRFPVTKVEFPKPEASRKLITP
jgi:hypothetical protein